MSWKTVVIGFVWGAALLAWGGLAGLYLTEPSVQVWAVGVTVDAVVTEIAFWTTAAVLGLSILESRKAAVRFVTQLFRGRRE